jgi:hypothetical protein
MAYPEVNLTKINATIGTPPPEFMIGKAKR